MKNLKDFTKYMLYFKVKGDQRSIRCKLKAESDFEMTLNIPWVTIDSP